ncbi:minor capsid protein [Sporohalobacter salinus]|uniref:phage head morphogenesis protein n=1 Tax=Sporohalobacter salinus TaxID=1494606 RepID=UPI001960456E|nr:minor capsid protein [Sporohalobacter salinus]MBM7623726.1 SPP1 gp7 family putative phage head morphogenesis protein [Sporohalobacter salinus]
MSKLITDIDRVVTEFLATTGSLPPFVVKTDLTEAEEQFHDRLQDLFAGVDQKVIDKLKEQNNISNEVSREKIVDKFGKELAQVPEVTAENAVSSAEEGKNTIITQLNQADQAILTNTFSEEVVENIKNKYAEYANETLARMQATVRDILTKGYKEGKGIDKVVDNLSKEFKQIEDYKLERIARTEINSAQNLGKQQSLRDNKVEYKQWITAGDSRVRGNSADDEADHTMMHGQVVKRNEYFEHLQEGWQLKYPGDRSGRIETWIHCRCTHRPYIPGKNEVITTTPYYPNSYAA